VTLSIRELEEPLKVALKLGLQFALFNSCSGLSIASSLIDLGLSQVAVMRSPIHNRVAEEFLLKFIQTLAEYKDVHESLISACQYIKLEKNLTYPSAYLIPSLFRHRETPLFKLSPVGIKQTVKKFMPSRKEAMAITVISGLSLLLPVQGYLLDKRLEVQAVYRNITGQLESKQIGNSQPNQREATVATPPVLLISIDDESIEKSDLLSNPKPINRQYIANLVDKLVASGAKVIGIDYILDRNQGKNDDILAKSIQTAINSPKPVWFVFASTSGTKMGDRRNVTERVASPNWSLQGDIDITPGYMSLLPELDLNSDSFSEPLSFANQLVISQELQQNLSSSLIPKPKLNSQQDLLSQIQSFLNSRDWENPNYKQSSRFRLQPLTALSYDFFQIWLHPIMDFSIPPNQAYQSISAWQLLEDKISKEVLENISRQIVIIAPGGYREAGIITDGEDNFDMPPAIAYWQQIDKVTLASQGYKLSGAEFHSYMVHHLSTKRLVIPIPDFWMLALAILLGKSTSIFVGQEMIRQQKLDKKAIYKKVFSNSGILILLIVSTTIYGVISLQVYTSSLAILLPFILPSVTLWAYILPKILGKKSK